MYLLERKFWILLFNGFYYASKNKDFISKKTSRKNSIHVIL